MGTQNKKKLNKEVYVHIRIDSDLKGRYKKYCKEKGYTFSKRIRTLLEKDLKKR